MHPASDFLAQLTHDRQQDRLAAAAVHRIAPSSSARTRIARSLRRTADRLDGVLVAQDGHPQERMPIARRPLKGAARGPKSAGI